MRFSEEVLIGKHSDVKHSLHVSLLFDLSWLPQLIHVSAIRTHSTNIRKFVDPIKAVYQSHCRIWLGQCQNHAEFYHITCALPVTALVPWQYENATLRNKVGMYIDILVIFSGSIAFLVDIFTIPSVQRHAINVRRLAKLQGSKALFATMRTARGQFIMISLS